MQVISVRSLAARLSLGFGCHSGVAAGMAVFPLLRMQALSATLEEITVHSAARSQTLDVMGAASALCADTGRPGQHRPRRWPRRAGAGAQHAGTVRHGPGAAGNPAGLRRRRWPWLRFVKTTGAAAREPLALGEKLDRRAGRRGHGIPGAQRVRRTRRNGAHASRLGATVTP